jgi:hypothetical protein
MLVGAVGIEPTTFGLKGRCSTTELRPCGKNFPFYHGRISPSEWLTIGAVLIWNCDCSASLSRENWESPKHRAALSLGKVAIRLAPN